jgi:hypothetical protein
MEDDTPVQILDTSHYFISLVEEMIGYEREISHPVWQSEKRQYFQEYCSFLMKKVYQIIPGTGFHIQSILPIQYTEDRTNLCINPDVDALMSFCMSLHKLGIYTTWTRTDDYWFVFVYRKK